MEHPHLIELDEVFPPLGRWEWARAIRILGHRPEMDLGLVWDLARIPPDEVLEPPWRDNRPPYDPDEAEPEQPPLPWDGERHPDEPDDWDPPF